MSNISLSAQVKKDHLISLYDLLPVVFLWTSRRKNSPSLLILKTRPQPEQKEICQTFNKLLSPFLPPLDGHLSSQARLVSLKWKACLTGLAFPWLSLHCVPILPFPPTHILQVDLIFRVSHWVSDSQAAVPSQREKSSSWKAVCPLRGKEKQVDLIELPNKVYLWTSLEQMCPCNCSHHLLMSHHGDTGKQIGLKTWFPIGLQWHLPPPASLARQHMTHSFLLTSKVL